MTLLGLTVRSISIIVFIASLAAPLAAGAQDEILAEARSSLSAYDVGEGGRTLRALHDLGPLAGRGDVEARYMRAVAAAEISAAATVLDDAPLRARLANALEVPEAELRAHLDAELMASRGGTFGRGATDARDLLNAASAFGTDPTRVMAMRGPHRDALVAMLVAEHADRGSLVSDPCAEARGAAAAVPGACEWDEPSRREVAALREGLLAARRAGRARTEGDPLLALLGTRLDAARATLLAIELHPGIELPETLGVADTDAPGAPGASIDVLAVVAEAEIHLRVMPVVRVDETGALVWVRGHDGGTVTVALPSTLPAVPQAIDALVAAATGLGLTPETRVGIAPTASVPSHVIIRTILSLAHAHLTATHLVAEHGGAHLVFAPITTTRESALESVGARVRVQMGGYAFGRGVRGRETRIPRVARGGEFVFDTAALEGRLASGTYSTVAVQVMGTVPAGEFIRVAFTVTTPSRAVILLMP